MGRCGNGQGQGQGQGRFYRGGGYGFRRFASPKNELAALEDEEKMLENELATIKEEKSALSSQSK
jgi:hypothetical protein